MSIVVTNLTKFYGIQKAVNDVSFSINKGEIVGFLGPNGAGKSTTMKMITGYLEFIANVHEVTPRGPAIERVISITGLTIEANKKIGQLSKGYKQRVGLAAALIHDPEVLILDEPTSGLDPNQIMEIRDVIKNLGQNKTVLFSSHILQEVEAICDRVIIINKGIIVADDKLLNLQKVNDAAQLVIVAFKEKVSPDILASLQQVVSIAEPQDGSYHIHTSDA